MKLIRAKIANFKSLENLDLKFNPNKMLIIGKNNSGKSNLLQIIGIMLKLGNSSYSLPSFNSELNNPEIYYSESKPLEVEFTFLLEGKTNDYPEEIREYIEHSEGKKILRLNLKKWINRDGEFFIGDTNVGWPEYVKTSKFIYFNSIVLWTNRSYKGNLSTEDRSNIYGVILARVVKTLVETKKSEIQARSNFSAEEFDKYFCDLLSKLFEQEIFLNKTLSDFKAIYFKPNLELKSLVFSLIEEDFPLSIAHDIVKRVEIIVNDGRTQSLDLKGMGIQSMFLVNLILQVNKFFQFKPLICIDEADLHLHPQAQRRFNQILTELSKTNQIILTTHSPIFISQMDIFDLILLKKNSSTHSLQLSSDCPLDKNIVKRELNEFNSEMLFADSVILVEGMSEKIILSYISNNWMDLDYNVDRKNISIIPVGGKENMRFYSLLLDYFEIPHVIVMDLDAINNPSNDILKKRKLELPIFKDNAEKIKFLNQNNIFILGKGEIEHYYPIEVLNKKFGEEAVNKAMQSAKWRVDDSVLEVVREVIINNSPIPKPTSEAEINSLRKNIQKWYDCVINSFRGAGKISLKSRKRYESLESLFGAIGKPRIAMEICSLLENPTQINPEFIEIIKRAIEIRNK